MSFQDVLKFWFGAVKPEQHFEKNAAFDELIRWRFAQTHCAGAEGALFEWRSETEGRLAEIIVRTTDAYRRWVGWMEKYLK